MKNLTNAIVENFLKNILIIMIALLSIPSISTGLKALTEPQLTNTLTIFSMLLLIACFACFTFSYGHTNMHSFTAKILGHITIAASMTLIAILLECIIISVHIAYNPIFSLVLALSILLYLSTVLFDFWDLLRAYNN